MMCDRYYDQHRLFNNQIDSEAVTIPNRRPMLSKPSLVIDVIRGAANAVTSSQRR